MRAAQEIVLPACTKTGGGEWDDGEVTFRVTQVAPKVAVPLATLVSRTLSPLLNLVPVAAAGTKSWKDVDLSKITPTAIAFLQGINGKDLEEMRSALFNGITVDGKPLTPMYDLVFLGHTMSVFRLLWFAITVNFQDFYVGALGLAARLAPAASSTATSDTSTGGSGAS